MNSQRLVLFLCALLFSQVAYGQKTKADSGPYTPARGSAERQAILDTLRDALNDQQIVFKVHYLKVHNGWCWVDTTPLDKQGQATAEGGPNLLHLQNGRWVVMDLSKVPDDPKDPMGAEDASPGFIRNLLKTYPGIPRDIFPKPGR